MEFDYEADDATALDQGGVTTRRFQSIAVSLALWAGLVLPTPAVAAKKAPTPPVQTYTLGIGDMTPGWLPYLCLFHDTSGMKAKLWVSPEFREPPCFPMGEWPWSQIPWFWSD